MVATKTFLLDSFEFNPKYPENLLEIARKFTKGSLPKYQTIPYMVVDDDGKTFKNSRNRACHGNLASTGLADGKRAAIINAIPTKSEKFRKYINFLVSDENPFSRFVFNRDTVFEDECLIHSADIPYVLSHCINMQTRLLTEHSSRIDHFNKLVDAGMHGHLAYLIGSTYVLSRDRVYVSYSHGINYSGLSEKTIINLMQGTLTNVPKDTYRNVPKYSGSSLVGTDGIGGHMYGHLSFLQTLVENSEEVREELRKFRKEPSEKVVVIKNPFEKTAYGSAKKYPWDFTEEEWFSIVVPFIVRKGLYQNGKTSKEI